MKYNLENSPKEAQTGDDTEHIRDWHEWIRGFEAELREKLVNLKATEGCFSMKDWNEAKADLIKEILGEEASR